jgi:hypothetical protein
MNNCGHKWYAQFLEPPPSRRIRYIEQICIEVKDHDGPHRSLTNVILPLDKSGRIGEYGWDLDV